MQSEVPPDGVLDFNDDTDDEAGNDDNAGDDGWGAAALPPVAAGFAEASNAKPEAEAQGGWGGAADGEW